MLIPMASFGQSVAGYWYGSAFITGSAGYQNSYMIELVLSENGRSVQGIMNYYFLNIYRSFPVTATFERDQQTLTFTNLPFVFYGSNPKMDVDCYMGGRFNLVFARAGTSLNGQWKSNDNYKNTCPPIQARLNLDKTQRITDSVLLAIKSCKENFKYWVADPSEKEQNLTTKETLSKQATENKTPSQESLKLVEKKSIQKPAPNSGTSSVRNKSNKSTDPEIVDGGNAGGQTTAGGSEIGRAHV